jgi:hypothetical protein
MGVTLIMERKKILVQNGAIYCELAQFGARRLHWLTVELAILIFDWEEEPA